MTIITKGMGAVLKAVKKGTPERKIKAKALREHRASESYKMHKKTMKKIPHDLTYMKGYLKGK